ncbi:hypothetical protein [Marinobacter sp.]|uniref:hypothetical protein n=1 Tax=Marinobacter sp. TaxID=50741 RepID=UPI003564716D
MHALYTGQLVGLAQDHEIEGSAELIRLISQAQSKLAELVAEHFDVRHGTTNFDLGEMCSSFGPKEKGQECPIHIGDLDQGSDWVNMPEDEEPLVPMVVIYKPKNGEMMPIPQAFRCCASDSDQAEQFCSYYADEPIEVLWVVETDNVAVAFDSYWRAAEPRPEIAGRKPSAPTVNDIQEYPVVIQDQERDYQPTRGTISVLPHGVAVRMEGHTDNASEDDMGELFTLIQYKGELQLVVFADVNQEEPTHTISLEAARNLNREILRPV